MSKNIHKNIFELVGKTPLVELTTYNKVNGLKADIIAKIEYFNPIGSVKDRIVLGMLNDAEKRGLAVPGKTTLVETTSGNTGIATAAIAAARGYKSIVYIQDNVSNERKQLIKAFGAKLINLSEEPVIAKALEESNGDFVLAIDALRKEVIEKHPDYFFLDQTSNLANPASHYTSTGDEIWADTEGDVDIFIAAVGTGGTLTGVGNHLKRLKPEIKVIGVQAKEDQEGITGVHPFDGVDPARIPRVLDRKVYDEAITVDEKDAFAKAREIAKTDGIFVGVSSGAILWAATEVAKRPENAGKKIVVVLPDTGLRYLSSGIFDEK